MNRISFIGNLGQDAIVNQLENGAKAIKFSVAITERYGKEDAKEITTWINCTMWKTPTQDTKIAPYLSKGTKVYVEGKPSASAYSNKQGQLVASLECRVDKLEFLSSLKDISSNDADKPVQPATLSNDDLPF